MRSNAKHLFFDCLGQIFELVMQAVTPPLNSHFSGYGMLTLFTSLDSQTILYRENVAFEEYAVLM